MTAVEELIKEMQQLKDTKLYQGSFKAIDDCIHLAYAKLELEKEQKEKLWTNEEVFDMLYKTDKFLMIDLREYWKTIEK